MWYIKALHPGNTLLCDLSFSPVFVVSDLLTVNVFCFFLVFVFVFFIFAPFTSLQLISSNSVNFVFTPVPLVITLKERVHPTTLIKR